MGVKRANLEAQAPHLPSDTKKRTFGVGRFEQKRSGDKAGDIGKNVQQDGEFGCFAGFCDQKTKIISPYRPMFLTTLLLLEAKPLATGPVTSLLPRMAWLRRLKISSLIMRLLSWQTRRSEEST